MSGLSTLFAMSSTASAAPMMVLVAVVDSDTISSSSSAAVLIFDQIGFFAALNLLLGVPFSAGLGGLIGKLAAAAFYSILIAVYLRWFEPQEKPAESKRLGDVFDILTYR
jgi:hypothetical protein